MSLRPSILFRPDASERMRGELASLGISCVNASEHEHAEEVDLIIFDAKALGGDVAVLRQGFEDSHPGVPVVVMGDAGLESAILAMRAGAADYIEASAVAGEVAAIVRRLISDRAIVSNLTGSSRASDRGYDLHGDSPKIRQLKERVAELAGSEQTVLISGETGTGKSRVSRLLHLNGTRARGSFVVVACSVIPASLAESELFGHTKGAFGAALTANIGSLRAADKGSLFLDDVDSLSLDVQAQLARALQRGSVRPLGATEEIQTDFRLLASTTQPLQELLNRGAFRQDLYQQLAVVKIAMPSLREREHDALPLAELFLGEASRRLNKSVLSLSTAAARALLAYRWPGNVRELKNAIDYAVTVAAFDHLSESDLPEAISTRRSQSGAPRTDDPRWSAVERQHIEAVLRSVDGNRARAARLLGIDRRTLHRKLERLAIDVPARNRTGATANGGPSKHELE